jgi:large conductance mechanosensitive channel
VVALAVFFLIRGINRMKREDVSPPEEPTTKECPFCISAVPIKARRCPFCTSELE